jgi:hypothetical protein
MRNAAPDRITILKGFLVILFAAQFRMYYQHALYP